MEYHRFHVNKRRNFRQSSRQSPTRMASPTRKTPTAPPLITSPNKPFHHRHPDPHKQLHNTNYRQQTHSALYPTLTSCYRRENLDYSPKEPIVDYPNADDLPINNLYPDLNIITSNSNIVESVVSNVDNTNTNQFSQPGSLNDNLNTNVVGGKVLLDKIVNVTAIQEDMRKLDLDLNCDYEEDEDVNPTPLVANDLATANFTGDHHFDLRQPPRNSDDFNRWMTWRKQVNRHMASMILLKQGKDVYVTPSEVNRKPLPKATMQSVFDNANTDAKGKTSLPGKRYIMYGIPRVQLLG